ncbi:RagB/SusD family nutrient uptake outer membrane protein [Chitinophaga horti]|uniref:RagB/SusD family nutrient uptake outer membrane protein n=1 Tax=Chitinophaga horti TaxID=2920382 RepID=A0ABY6J181_9BACT|nr:RagB/SusD family nutrient uptake outer membrane protein [Chitinophaga horti]UYQ92126.1 RagB/SusD family nutrient uptake outer membrane protein [Chitinophaga horti]
MKRSFFNIFYIAALAGMLTSCEKGFLDRAATNQQQDKDIFSNYETTNQVIANLYSRTPRVLRYVGGNSMLASATDESKDASTWMNSFRFNNGSWSGSDNPIGNSWRDCYVAIRQANSILEGIEKYGTPDDPNNPGFLQFRRGEVFFLRAFFLAELMKQFGGVIIVTKTVDINDLTILNGKRSTYDSCLAQVIKDCDSAYNLLPAESWEPEHSGMIGRVKKGVALALKSRMTLYAASPLWAIAGKTGPKGDISPQKTASDPEKWAAAAAAAKAVIEAKDRKGQIAYQLEPNLAARQAMFISKTLTSREVIWMRMKDDNQDFDRYAFPFGSSGWSGASPSQNLAGDYEMQATGLHPSAPGSGYNPAQPFVGRDPRFYTDILYNDATFKNRRLEYWSKTDTWPVGKDEMSTATDHSRTGYSMRKLVDAGYTVNQGPNHDFHGIVYRLAEFYLNYAEAQNEVLAAPDQSVYDAINAVRVRAGVKPILVGTMTKEQMRDAVRHERRIELAFEGHRFWDVRRWKIASETETALWGMKTTKNPDGSFTYEVVKVEDRPFAPRMYMIPITQDETLRNPNLEQNPEW